MDTMFRSFEGSPARLGPTTLLGAQNTELFATHSIVADWEKNLMIGLLWVNDTQNMQPHYAAYFKLSVVRGSSSLLSTKTFYCTAAVLEPLYNTLQIMGRRISDGSLDALYRSYRNQGQLPDLSRAVSSLANDHAECHTIFRIATV
jgi:hypothetical protein